MQYPTEVLEIVSECVEKFPDDIQAAAEEAERSIRLLPGFKVLVNQLVERAVKEMVYAERCKINHARKTASGAYHTKVKPGHRYAENEEAVKVDTSVYNYYIGGVTLGSLLGRELDEVACSEAEIAKGHLFNVDLCKEVRKYVSDDVQVRQALKADKLQEIFNKVRRGGRTKTRAKV